ncbi:ribosomal protein S18 acetylase RimI-like enzyme [Yoonia maricola]|uniref:Ribosomal protein S18 acetylase RimI-like enzyme n=1 Tax=Yoonia maricola TaxID=420999 RepID=A0A2M8WK07_9RHOB|nr:ribosomal protein S18 acetylase RimI-like enzyme [Yoonia maricola]
MPTCKDASGLLLRPLQRADWGWVLDWFSDPWLNKELGPLDDAWLEHVLNQPNGIELVATESEQPIGLTGITWSDATSGYHTITSLSVNPAQRGRGIGRKVLDATTRWSGHPKGSGWIAFVTKDNLPPAKLLLSAGWLEDSETKGMRKFRWT